jgi:hypothetical protein
MANRPGMSQVAAQNWQHTPRAGESKVAARARAPLVVGGRIALLT